MSGQYSARGIKLCANQRSHRARAAAGGSDPSTANVRLTAPVHQRRRASAQAAANRSGRGKPLRVPTTSATLAGARSVADSDRVASLIINADASGLPRPECKQSSRGAVWCNRMLYGRSKELIADQAVCETGEATNHLKAARPGRTKTMSTIERAPLVIASIGRTTPSAHRCSRSRVWPTSTP